MIGMVESVATVTIYGDDTDTRVRGRVLVECGDGGSVGATVEGDPEVFVDGGWHRAWDFVGDTDVERIEEALCAEALDT